ncbi:MAG: amidohydrolase, partial [Bacteroidetes bacterium]|nr:amidohydrolase [Bacteroidota bacterium]
MHRILFFLTGSLLILSFSACGGDYYSNDDFSSVLKIDSHIHINSDKGDFEDQAVRDNFVLITLGVDHGDSANIRSQQENATLSAAKFPGRVFYGPTFLFDTAGWGTDTWSK